MNKDRNEKIDDLNNFEAVVQNGIAQAANIGTFAMGVDTVTDFTQINPNTMEADNYQKIKDEHTANFHGKIIAK